MDLIDADYKLIQGKAWIEVKGFAIRIAATDEGVVVDVYKSGDENSDSIVSCYAFDSDLLPNEEEP